MAAQTRGPLIAEAVYTLRGANYFSWDPVVVLRLDLASYDEVFTNQIPDFPARLKATLPSLIEHKCSEGERGGFFFRVDTGTLLGHVLEHVALELQALAGIDVAFGKTRSTARQGVYNVVFRYEDEEVGIRAAELAYDLINNCLLGEAFDVESAVDELERLRESQMGSFARALIEEASLRSIPTRRLRDGRILFGSGRQGRIAEAFDPAGDSLNDLAPKAAEVLDEWFQPGCPTHAPLYALAGARGANLAARLLMRCLQRDGLNVLTCNAQNPAEIESQFIDRQTDLIIIEVPIQTILEHGLPYHRADTGIVLNASGQPPVSDDLTNPEDLAYALAVTVEEVHNAGVAVLNADDPHVLEMARRLYARPVFFTRERNLRFVSEHVIAGNIAIVLTGNRITFEQRREERLICTLDELPYLRGLRLGDTELLEALIDATLGVMAALAGNGWTPWAIERAMRDIESI